jgi:hypothetical protein
MKLSFPVSSCRNRCRTLATVASYVDGSDIRNDIKCFAVLHLGASLGSSRGMEIILVIGELRSVRLRVDDVSNTFLRLMPNPVRTV